jgi:hypothetical protein
MESYPESDAIASQHEIQKMTNIAIAAAVVAKQAMGFVLNLLGKKKNRELDMMHISSIIF